MVYVIDTSTLVDLYRHYPLDVFTSLWANVDMLIESEDLMAPLDVHEEIKRRQDELLEWAGQRREMFLELDEETQVSATEIINRFSKTPWIDTDKEETEADPFVIALARVKGGIVVCEERASGSLDGPRIPDICEYYSVQCMNRFDFFRHNGWTF